MATKSSTDLTLRSPHLVQRKADKVAKSLGLKARAIEASKDGKLLPHQWLLKVASGEPVPHTRCVVTYDSMGNVVSQELVTEDYYADFATRIDAAKYAAPYYAPKLVPKTVGADVDTIGALTDVLKEFGKKLPG